MIPVIPNVTFIRHKLKKRISNPSKFIGHEEERKRLKSFIERVLQFHESDSALLCGPPGSGKTKLLDIVLKELDKEHEFFRVKLNGLIHTDDSLALKEIIKTFNADESIIEEASCSFAGNLTAVLGTLLSNTSSVDKPVVFILEEFELFCTHRKQTLLYTLMDASQSVKVPVCVVGVTSCFEVTQLLEKRVKSRFSHNQIFLYPSNDFTTRLALFEHFLSTESNDILQNCETIYIYTWKQEVRKILDNPKVIEVLRRQFSVDKNEQTFRNTMLVVISKLEPEHGFITAADIISVFNNTFRDQTVFALHGLSVLELCLVIAMNHQTNLYDDEPFNFEMIARRVSNFTNQSSVIVNTSRAVLMKAFQKLINLELITPVSAHSKEALKEFNLYRFNVTHEQVQTAVQTFSELSSSIKDWATSALN